MISDRRVSGDGERFRPADKVFKNDDLLVGVVGNFSAVRAMKKLMKPGDGPRNPDDLMVAIDDESMALCVYEGRLYEITNDDVECIPERYHAVGSGQHAVLGFLAGKDIDVATCKDAIKIACTFRIDCGDGVKLVEWG